MPVSVLSLTEQGFQSQHCHNAQELKENTVDQALFLHGYPQHENAPKSSAILNPAIKVFYCFHSLNSSHRDIKSMTSSLQKAMSNSIYNKKTLTQRLSMFIPTQGTKHIWSDQSRFVSFFFFPSKLSNALCTHGALILTP